MLFLVKNVPLCRDHGLSDVINIQVKASSCQEEHQQLVSKTVVAWGEDGGGLHVGF